MKVKALVLTPGELPDVREVDAGLAALQQLVGGPLEAIRLDDEGTHMYVNEEGKQRRTVVINETATGLAVRQGRIDRHDIVVGTVVVLGANSDEEADCPQWVIDMARR
jgi:hypothetical protein